MKPKATGAGMKVTLISVYESVTPYGVRLLSAVLKEAGFKTQLVFLPRETEGIRWDGFCYPYPDSILDQVAELTSDSELIGISLMTNYFQNAVQITERLRQSTNAPIIWGGIHPTVSPEECLEHADIVCVGEGEEALLELAQRLAQEDGYKGIDNMWYREDGKVVRTPLRPLQFDLDIYPYPDYDLDTSFVLHQGHIRSMTPDLLSYYSRWPPYVSESVLVYETIMSRGCSRYCTYCCNNALRSIYNGEWRVRRRSVEHLIGELQQAIARFPGFQLIQFNDDEFIRDLETVREFCDAYRQTANVPFSVVGFEPPMVDEEKIGLLVDAGMKIVYMGIQTGCMRTMHQIYRRPVRREHIVQATRVLNKFVGRIDPPVYDLIVDNPWETEQDQLETISMLLDIPRPYKLQLFSLTLYPGTELCERGKREGLLRDEGDQVYLKHYILDNKRTYINGLFKLVQSQRAPRWLMALLTHDSACHLNWAWLTFSLNGMLRIIQLLELGWRAVLSRDWNRITRYLRLYLGRRFKTHRSSP
jgi:anaerobic magnesium-protoporphyrin IX monomethyl ester cyclase